MRDISAIKSLLIFFLCSLLLFAATPSRAVTVECSGHVQSRFNLIYLHGLDSKKPGNQELENRSMLRKLSKKLSFSLAIMRSSQLCKNKVCWPHQDPKAHKQTFKKIINKSRTCFAPEPKKKILLGFSNGGYFAAKIVQRCYQGLDLVIASGSGGRPVSPTSEPKQKCPPLTFLIGKKDLSFPKVEPYAKSLKELGRKVLVRTFSGGHALDENTLTSSLNW